MYDYLIGQIQEITPTYTILENQGIGYFVNISVTTYSEISENKECKLYIHEVIREDAHLLFGFNDKRERDIFLHLISVSGVGANTARMILSSLTPDEVQVAILENDVNSLKNVKGIGIKSAQRIIVDLKDKIGKLSDDEQLFKTLDNTIQEEALSALVMLGFPNNKVEKVIGEILKRDKSVSVEELVKESLKRI